MAVGIGSILLPSKSDMPVISHGTTKLPKRLRPQSDGPEHPDVWLGTCVPSTSEPQVVLQKRVTPGKSGGRDSQFDFRWFLTDKGIMAGRGGYRPGGGRPKGSLSKATTEAREKAARLLDAARSGKAPKPLAKDILEDAMFIAKGATASFQRVTPEQVEEARAAGNLKARPQNGDIDKFGEWFDRMVYAATQLAKYQSPTFRAIFLQQDTIAAAPAAEPGKVLDLQAERDPLGAEQTYLRLIKAPRDTRAA
jgi:hypothetical protein